MAAVTVAEFKGFGEFARTKTGEWSNKDCSADAALMARHPFDEAPLTAETLNAYWDEMWRTGHHTANGATLGHTYWLLTGSKFKLDPARARVIRYIPTGDVSREALRLAIFNALHAGQTCVVYLGNASGGLSYNERGIRGHFIALGGIDGDDATKDFNVLVGNGDDQAALGGHTVIPTRWYHWSDLEKAAIDGMIALERVTVSNTVPNGWHDDGTTLKSAEGVPIVHGFRQYVLANNWTPGNPPLGPEYACELPEGVEPGNHAIGAGARQDFKFGSLGWTQARGVYVIAVGQDFVALKNERTSLRLQVAQLQGEIADLQQQLAAAKAAAAPQQTPAPTPAEPAPDPALDPAAVAQLQAHVEELQAEVAAALSGAPTEYEIQPEDRSLADIAAKLYGDAGLAEYLHAANRQWLPDPETLRTGLVLRVPPRPARPEIEQQS